MFDYSKLSNTVGSSSDFGMKYISEIGWADFVGIRLEFHLSSLENCPFLA